MGQVGERDQSKDWWLQASGGSESILCTWSSNKQGTHRFGRIHEDQRSENWGSCVSSMRVLWRAFQVTTSSEAKAAFRLVSCLNLGYSSLQAGKSSLGHKSLAERKKSTTCGSGLRAGPLGASSRLQKGPGCWKGT